jgi:CHAT domain-containing protein
VTNMGTLLERYIEGTRDALGIDFNVSGSTRNLCSGDSEGEGGTSSADLWSQHLEELGDKMNQDSDKTGFLRMVSRNHRFNCSSYSLSSLFSVGSATGSVKSTATSSRPGSTRSRQRRSSWQGPSCLRSLYQMLIAPFEEELNVLDQTCFKELVLVLESDLLLVPFSILRSCINEEYLCEKFKLIVAPSLSSIRSGARCKSKSDTSIPLVVGNPLLPSEVTDQWGWEDIPRAQNEASMIAEILQCQPLVGAKATRENVLKEMYNAECIHLATHISWKLSAIVLSPPGQSSTGDQSSSSKSDGSDEQAESMNSDAPPFSEYLLTAADILKIRLNAKLVVLSSCHTRDKMGLPNSESVIALTKALLAAGAMAVMVTLWPVPETASKIFFRALYSSLLQGSKVSHALSEAMLTVQHTKHFAHPANWAGYLLIGSDVQLSNKVALTGQAMWELMKSPERSRDALRVSLHLVEKSLQRINNGQKNAMYTTQKSIENKVGNVTGWKEILMSVGFRFEAASNGLPAAVFFPQSDPGERLVKCSASLQALLGKQAEEIQFSSFMYGLMRFL